MILRTPSLEKAQSISELYILHVVGQVTHPIFVPETLSVAQPAEPIVAPPYHVEVLSADILQTVFEVQNGTSVRACDSPAFLSILVPRPAIVSPHRLLEELLRIRVEVGNCFRLRGDGSILSSCDQSPSLHSTCRFEFSTRSKGRELTLYLGWQSSLPSGVCSHRSRKFESGLNHARWDSSVR